jgi:hypothetical protein
MAAVGIAEHLVRGIAQNQRRGRGSNLLLHDGSHTRIGVDRSRSIEAAQLILGKYPPGSTRYVTVDAWDDNQWSAAGDQKAPELNRDPRNPV